MLQANRPGKQHGHRPVRRRHDEDVFLPDHDEVPRECHKRLHNVHAVLTRRRLPLRQETLCDRRRHRRQLNLRRTFTSMRYPSVLSSRHINV